MTQINAHPGSMTASQLSDSIVGILDGVQSSVANRPKLLITFRTLYEKTGDIAGFFNAFFPPFSNVLLVYKREPAVERVVSFVTSFAIKTAQKEKEGKDELAKVGASCVHFHIPYINITL